MSSVRISGQLICAAPEEADAVRRHLPRHVELTRAEPGCVAFDVCPTDDPWVWQVHEEFVDGAALEAHQRRVAASEWGSATTGIKRRYCVDGGM